MRLDICVTYPSLTILWFSILSIFHLQFYMMAFVMLSEEDELCKAGCF